MTFLLRSEAHRFAKIGVSASLIDVGHHPGQITATPIS
jgi:hypothetical protein